MFQWILNPLNYPFMQRSMLVSLLVGILCAVIGCYVVLRGMAFLGDALAHAILPGVAIAYLLHGSLLLGGLIAAVIVDSFRGRASSKKIPPLGFYLPPPWPWAWR